MRWKDCRFVFLSMYLFPILSFSINTLFLRTQKKWVKGPPFSVRMDFRFKKRFFGYFGPSFAVIGREFPYESKISVFDWIVRVLSDRISLKSNTLWNLCFFLAN